MSNTGRNARKRARRAVETVIAVMLYGLSSYRECKPPEGPPLPARPAQ